MFSHHQVEQVQQQLVTLETEAERLRSQLHAVTQEKLSHAQEANELQRKLRDALNQVEQLEGAAGTLARQEEELRVQNQELQRQVTLTRTGMRLCEASKLIGGFLFQLYEVQKLNSEQQDLKTRLDQAEAAQTQAQDQVRIRIRISTHNLTSGNVVTSCLNPHVAGAPSQRHPQCGAGAALATAAAAARGGGRPPQGGSGTSAGTAG